MQEHSAQLSLHLGQTIGSAPDWVARADHKADEETTMLTINIDTARRFILGKQGLWPGRRWRGSPGTEQAMRDMEYLQLDPLQIIARSHDITLHSRVLDYTPSLWEEVTYQQRTFFDWGGWLAVRPMDELPYWRVVMRRERDGHPDCDSRVRKTARDHADAIDEMRTLLQEQGEPSRYARQWWRTVTSLRCRLKAGRRCIMRLVAMLSCCKR